MSKKLKITEFLKRENWPLNVCPNCGSEGSFRINDEKGLFNCIGCKGGGDLISLAMAVKGLSFSGAIEYLKEIIGYFRNPVFLFIFKDIFSIANRNKISMEQDIFKGMNVALRRYGRMLLFIKNNNPPGFLISYDKAIESKDKLILDFVEHFELKVSEKQIQEAKDFIQPNPPEYLESTRITHSMGKIDIL